MKKTLLTGMVLMSMAWSASAGIVPMPGVMGLGSDGDAGIPNNAVPGTYIYGRNSVVLTNNAGALEITTGGNNFDAISLGFGNANENHADRHSFSVSAGDSVSFYFDFKPAAGVTGTPTFQIRLNEGNNSEGERLSVTTTATDIGGGVTRYELSDYTITQPSGSETVNRMDVFVSFGTSQGFVNDTYQGDLVGAYIIPEPATLGLVAVFGGGVLFIRRRMML